jgi:hypothetical protein
LEVEVAMDEEGEESRMASQGGMSKSVLTDVEPEDGEDCSSLVEA